MDFWRTNQNCRKRHLMRLDHHTHDRQFALPACLVSFPILCYQLVQARAWYPLVVAAKGWMARVMGDLPARVQASPVAILNRTSSRESSILYQETAFSKQVRMNSSCCLACQRSGNYQVFCTTRKMCTVSPHCNVSFAFGILHRHDESWFCHETALVMWMRLMLRCCQT